MKLGFSSIACPTWDLRTIIEQCVLMGYDGFELRGLQGELHLPAHPELAQNHQAVVQACQATKVELVCLASSASFGSTRKKDVADQKAIVREYIELAEQLKCPYVRVFSGDIVSGSNRYETLGRITQALIELADFAGQHKVTILMENSGELASSKDIWFLLDAVDHPALKACWNPINGLSVNDRSTIAVPRLGVRMGLVHVTDAIFADTVMESLKPLGEGNTDVVKLVEFLTGVGYPGYLMFDWPKLWDSTLAEPQQILPAALKFLKAQLNIDRKPLSAYKGDDTAPKFQPRQPIHTKTIST